MLEGVTVAVKCPLILEYNVCACVRYLAGSMNECLALCSVTEDDVSLLTFLSLNLLVL